MRKNRQTKGPANLWNRLTTGGAALSMVAGLAGLTAAFTYPTEVYAQDTSGSKARVNLSARLRSLSEDTAASTCRVQAGVSSDESLVHLKLVRDTFDTILSGLENGDKRLGIPTAEERGSLLKKIAEIHALWNPMRSAIDNMLAGTAAPSDYDVVASSFRELLLETERFAAAISGAYSDPTSLLQSDAVTLNFLGRQRSLATRVARTTCGIYAENSEIGTGDEFTETSSVFDQSFQALISGFPAAGIAPPPSDAVKTVLQEVYDDWKVQETDLLAKMDTPATLSDAVSHAATFSQDAVQQVNNAITLYLIASPGQEDVFKAALEQYAQEQLLEWLEDPQVINSLKEQNAAHANLTQDDIDALDLEWRAEAKGGDGPLIADTLAKPISVWLQDKQTATAGIVTEVFIMDNKGLNVGQSAQTSDYWQGDEAKWKETFGKSEATMHVGDLEFDESSRSYQTQASQLIVDPQSGEPLGAVTFGINVINLM